MKNKEEPKTLKDFGTDVQDEWGERIYNYSELKAEAIKWVKEDIEVEKRLHPDDKNTWLICLQRWMKRLNITEEDLK